VSHYLVLEPGDAVELEIDELGSERQTIRPGQ
jgi:hypothetical protein